jgi:plasmid replication initiation protein
MRFPRLLIPVIARCSRPQLQIILRCLACKKKEIEIPITDLITSHGGSGYLQVRNALTKLKHVIIEGKNGKFSYETSFLVFSKISQAIAIVEYHVELKNIIYNMHKTGYFTINLKSALALQSPAAARLYVYASQFKKQSQKTVSIEGLKLLLKLSGYSRGNNFRACLGRLISEVNQKTELLLSFEEKKLSRKIESIDFDIRLKKDFEELVNLVGNSNAEKYIDEYGQDYIKLCLRITREHHNPKKGSASGYFQTILENNFSKWKLERKENFKAKKVNEKVKKQKAAAAAKSLERDLNDPEKISRVPEYARKFLNVG